MPFPTDHLAAAPLAFIDGVGGMELVLIMIVLLLLFGGQGLPNAARTLGRTLRELKRASSGIEDEIKRAMQDEPAPKPPPKKPLPTPTTPAITEPVSAADQKPEPAEKPAPENTPEQKSEN